jgi:hypothetical protein
MRKIRNSIHIPVLQGSSTCSVRLDVSLSRLSLQRAGMSGFFIQARNFLSRF